MINLTNETLLNFTIPAQETITALTCNEFYTSEFTTQIITSFFIGFIILVLYWLDTPYKELTKREFMFKLLLIIMYIAYVLTTIKQLT